MRKAGIYLDIEDIKKEYDQGSSLTELAEKWNWSEMTIHRALIKIGTHIRRTGPRKKKDGKRYANGRWAILEAQGFCCKICEVSYKEKDLDLDYDHETGKVRGFLCHSCNILVTGMEKTELKKKALDYLRQEPLNIKYDDVSY